MATTEKWAKLFKSRHQYMDSVPVQFGDAKDVALTWDGTNLTLKPVTDDTGAFIIGDGTTDMDFKVFMNTSAKYVLFDQSGSLVTFVGTALTLGADTAGVDLKLFGATTGNYLLWDASEDDLTLVGTATQLAVAGTTAASSATTGSIHTAGGIGIAGALWVGTTSRLVGAVTADATLGIVGTITVSPAAAGTFLDFALETEWVSGTLIDADFGSATTLSNDTIGFDMDFNANITMTTDKDVTAYQIKLPALSQTAANTTLITGISLPTAGALVQSSGAGTITWKGINLQLPNTTQTTGTVNSYGMYVTPGTVTSGTQYGIYMAGGLAFLPMQVGVKSSSAGDGFKIVGSGDNSGGIQLYADDGGAAAAGEVITPFRSRYLLTVNQSGGISQTALFAQLVSGGSGTRTYTTGAFRAAYIFNQQGTTTLATSAECLGINQATTLAGTMTVGSGCTFAGVDVNIAGAGAISNSGTCAALLVRSSGTPVWTNGVQIKDSGAVTGVLIGAVTTGINIVGATSALTATSTGTGITCTTSALHATTGRVGKFFGTVAAPNQGDGYGAFEVDITASGTFAGTTNAFSSWLNVAAEAVPGGNLICAQNNGIWLASGITASSAKMIMGMRMQYVADDGEAPGSLFCFSTNIYSNVLTAIFDVNTIVDLGGSTGAVTTNAYKIPLFRDASAGKTWYVNVYDG